MTDISNTDDVIDSRAVIERIEELRAERDALKEAREEVSHEDPEGYGKAVGECQAWEEDYAPELAALEALAEEASGSPDWPYGETLVRDSYFKEYAQQLAEDCGMIPDNLAWPMTCIDWEKAARELRYDYSAVDFDGVTYWIRS